MTNRPGSRIFATPSGAGGLGTKNFDLFTLLLQPSL